jgi:hypothetical protein
MWKFCNEFSSDAFYSGNIMTGTWNLNEVDVKLPFAIACDEHKKEIRKKTTRTYLIRSGETELISERRPIM